MSKWMLVTVLALQAHFAASYLVPLDRQAQAEFRGLLRWFWPWSYGDGGLLGHVTAGQDLPTTGLFLALGLYFAHEEFDRGFGRTSSMDLRD